MLTPHLGITLMMRKSPWKELSRVAGQKFCSNKIAREINASTASTMKFASFRHFERGCAVRKFGSLEPTATATPSWICPLTLSSTEKLTTKPSICLKMWISSLPLYKSRWKQLFPLSMMGCRTTPRWKFSPSVRFVFLPWKRNQNQPTSPG